MDNDTIIKKRTAREILSMIELVCFSDEYREYRIDNGSNGQRDIIIKMIKNNYDIS